MKELVVALIIVLVIAIIICMPIALIWSLNTLFPLLNIPLTFSTWAAAFFILSIIGSGSAVKASK